MFDNPMQLSQMVAGHRGVHMMFGVVIHVEVNKFQERIQEDGSTTESKIAHVVLQACVLGHHTQVP